MLVSQDLFRVQVPAGVTGGTDDVSPCTAVLPRAPGAGVECVAASAEDDISIEALLAGGAGGVGGRVQMRTKWVAGYSANAAVGLFAGLGLANWGFDTIPVSGLCAAGTCGIVAGVVITTLALACVGAAIYAGIRPERLPGWWPSRSTLVLRGLSWMIGDLVAGLVSMRPVRSSDRSAASGVAKCSTGEPSSVAAAHSHLRLRAEATPKYGPQGIFTRSGAPIIRVAIR